MILSSDILVTRLSVSEVRDSNSRRPNSTPRPERLSNLISTEERPLLYCPGHQLGDCNTWLTSGCECASPQLGSDALVGLLCEVELKTN
ncbi:hypothetical protein J6590_037936 [Homalodisca vitripennis]|nr:hypothetical protein J6590_037936 [Homalodisca vitripennis]